MNENYLQICFESKIYTLQNQTQNSMMGYKKAIKNLLNDEPKLISQFNDNEELARFVLFNKSHCYYSHLSERLREIPEFAVKCDDWYYIPDKLKKSKEFFIEYMKKNERAINRRSANHIFHHSDDETIKKILTTEGYHSSGDINFFSNGFEKWANNKEIMMLLIKKFPSQYKYITSELKYDADIVREYFVIVGGNWMPFKVEELKDLPSDIRKIVKDRMLENLHIDLEQIHRNAKKYQDEIDKINNI